PIYMILLRGVWCVLRLLLLPRSQLVLENLALRQQLAILRRSAPRPRLLPWDRLFWVWLSRCWAGWKDALVIVSPATVVGWHRQGFRLYWRWKSRGRAGRPCINPELLSIPKMALWQTCAYLCDLSVGELSSPKVRRSFQAANKIVTRSIGLALNGPFCVDPAGRRGFRDSQEEFSAGSDAAAWVEGRSISAYPEPTRKTNQHATISAKTTFSGGTPARGSRSRACSRACSCVGSRCTGSAPRPKPSGHMSLSGVPRRRRRELGGAGEWPRVRTRHGHTGRTQRIRGVVVERDSP